MKYIDKDNFCIKITADNKNAVKTWWYDNHYDGRQFNLEAHYGHKDGNCYSITNGRIPNVEVISFEEFKLYILIPKQESYEIF